MPLFSIGYLIVLVLFSIRYRVVSVLFSKNVVDEDEGSVFSRIAIGQRRLMMMMMMINKATKVAIGEASWFDSMRRQVEEEGNRMLEFLFPKSFYLY